MPDLQDETREIIARYLSSLPAQTGKKLSAIARELGMAASTLTNPVNRPEEVKSLTSMTTLLRVSRHTGVPLPTDLMGSTVPSGFREEEARAYTPGDAGNARLDKLIKEFKAGRAGIVEPWTLNTSALRDFGYLPGDIVILDQNLQPFEGDIVAIQWIDKPSKKTLTLWRKYRKPYYIASSSEDPISLPIDERHADAVGVVIATFRGRPVT